MTDAPMVEEPIQKLPDLSPDSKPKIPALIEGTASEVFAAQDKLAVAAAEARHAAKVSRGEVQTTEKLLPGGGSRCGVCSQGSVVLARGGDGIFRCMDCAKAAGTDLSAFELMKPVSEIMCPTCSGSGRVTVPRGALSPD